MRVYQRKEKKSLVFHAYCCRLHYFYGFRIFLSDQCSDWMTINCEKIDNLQKTEDMKKQITVINWQLTIHFGSNMQACC